MWKTKYSQLAKKYEELVEQRQRLEQEHQKCSDKSDKVVCGDLEANSKENDAARQIQVMFRNKLKWKQELDVKMT